ncbi:hypothetical protein B0H21DRAFT_825011 [Amylocystis lapponica]|nr:hypothetical protein B0H21DRAFT_825011 [Amylocystis lapponica]
MPNVMRSSPPRPSSVSNKARSTTSSKCRSSSVVTDDEMQVKNEDALSHMKVEFHDKIHREYPVQEFAKHVWSFDEKDHPDLHLKISSFSPRPAVVEMYNDAPNEMARAVQSSIIFVQYSSATGVGEYTSFRPDLTWSTLPKSENPPWDWLPLFAEDILQGNVPESTSTSLKRKNPDSESDGVEPSLKRRKINAVTSHEAQTAKYLNEMLSHGIRSFASGFFIKDREMQLWYGDRMGLVKSCTFDWQAKPALMALVFAAFGTANLARLGISPFLEFSPTSPKFDSYEGGHIVLPVNEVMIGDNQERPSEDMVFKIDTTRRVWTEWGAVGRGTTIVPLKAIGAAAGRFGTEELVAKMAWSHASRTSEEKFIRIVRSKLQQKASSYLRHIVDLKCFVTRNMAEMGLPRAFMNIELAEDDKRAFQVMVMRKYEQLESVESVDEFKTVFEHVVRAHHWVWMTSGVLHHDISTGNVMFYRGADGHVVGMLCDWDLAEEKPSDAEYQADDDRIFDVRPVWPEGPIAATNTQEQHDMLQSIKGEDNAVPQKHPLRPRYRAGTGPFIALEILKTKDAPLHRYGHDLESLFYLLAYVCAVFDPTRHRFRRFDAWEQGDLDCIALSKTSLFLDGEPFFMSTFSSSHKDYRPLVEEWVRPLWTLFSRAAMKRLTIICLVDTRRDEARMGREHVVAELDAEIASSITAWRKMITYDAFMARLGLPCHLPTDSDCPSCDVPISRLRQS